MISTDTADSRVSPFQHLMLRVSWEKFALGLFLFLGLWARVHAIGRQSIWIDEAYSLNLARGSISSIVGETARDNHPPLYYLMLACWERLGPTGESWARLLSALLGTLLILAFYQFCCEVTTSRVPIVAAGLLCISPLAVWHSQDARMYSLMLTATYSAVSFQLMYVRLGHLRWLFLSTLMLVAALYSHIYSVLILPALLVHLLLGQSERQAKRTRNALVAIGVSIFAFLPWAYIIATSALHRAGFYKPISWLTIPYTGYVFGVGYSFGPSVASLHQSWGQASLWSHLGSAVGLTIAAFGVPFGVGLFQSKKTLGRFRVLVIGLLVCPVLIPVVVTFLSSVDFNVRYAILAFPVFLLLVAIGLIGIPSYPLRVLSSAVIVVLMLVSLWNYYKDPIYYKEDSREAVSQVLRRWRAGDCLLVIGVRPAFQYYAGSALTSRWLDFRTESGVEQSKQTIKGWTETCTRLWFVAGREWEEDPIGLAMPTIETFFSRASEESVPGIRILQLIPKTGGNLGRSVRSQQVEKDFNSAGRVANS